MTAQLHWSTLLAFLMVSSCGDDGPGKFSSGVDGSKPLGGLTADEAAKLCRSADEWARQAISQNELKEFACKLGGALTAVFAPNATEAQLREMCTQSYSQCMMSPPAASMSPTMCQKPPATCMSTVAEYEACVNDLPGGYAKVVGSIPSCDMLTRNVVLQLAALAASLPPSCLKVQMKCPQVFGLPQM